MSYSDFTQSNIAKLTNNVANIRKIGSKNALNGTIGFECVTKTFKSILLDMPVSLEWVKNYQALLKDILNIIVSNPLPASCKGASRLLYCRWDL